MDEQIRIRPIDPEDRPWIQVELRKWWGDQHVVIRKTKYDLLEMDGFIAAHLDGRIGLIITRTTDTTCEIMSLTTSGSHPKTGILLVEEVIADARKNGYDRIIVVTTNDNTSALRFYQKAGFNIHALRKNILEESRKIKPEIPLIGNHHIPIRDEIELEMTL
jgi:ribosomal protein S18 acetylase RimI-like enzyme